MEHPIVGDTPLLIKANKICNNNNNNSVIMLNNQNAQKLIYLTKNNMLKDTGVIIVLD